MLSAWMYHLDFTLINIIVGSGKQFYVNVADRKFALIQLETLFATLTLFYL
jgi:hypothetical protein